MLTLKDILITEDCSLASSNTLQAALEKMSANGAGVVVIVDGLKPIGILTERDIVRILKTGSCEDSILESFRKPLITVSGDRTLLFAANIMIGRNIRRLVVVDRQNNFQGIVIQEDLIRQLEGETYQRNTKVFHILYNRKPLITLPHDAPVSQVVSLMADNEIGSVVITEGEHIAGIITERDILKLAARKFDRSLRSSEVMSKPVITADVDTSIIDLVRIMQNRRIRRIVIGGAQGIPLGIITSRDLLRNIEGSYSEFLKNKLSHAREILDFLPQIVVEVADMGTESLIEWCNKRTRQEFGRDLLDQPVTALIPASEWAPVSAVLAEQGKIERHNVVIGDKTYEVAGSRRQLHRENIIQLTMRNITEEVNQATKDFLTDLFNRRKIEETLDTELARASRYDSPLSVILFDVDHFKDVNDTCGHQRGDRVLQEMSNLIKPKIRRIDFLGRWGGEEFIIVCPGLDRAGAAKLAEKVRSLTAAYAFEEAGKITISLGVASYFAGDTVTTLIGRADAALYRAKADGRNRTELA